MYPVVCKRLQRSEKSMYGINFVIKYIYVHRYQVNVIVKLVYEITDINTVLMYICQTACWCNCISLG